MNRWRSGALVAAVALVVVVVYLRARAAAALEAAPSGLAKAEADATNWLGEKAGAVFTSKYGKPITQGGLKVAGVVGAPVKYVTDWL